MTRYNSPAAKLLYRDDPYWTTGRVHDYIDRTAERVADVLRHQYRDRPILDGDSGLAQRLADALEQRLGAHARDVARQHAEVDDRSAIDWGAFVEHQAEVHLLVERARARRAEASR